MVFFPSKNSSLTFCNRFPTLSRKTNRVFVSLMNENRAYACIGRLDNNSSVCNKVKNILDQDLTHDLQSGRLGSTSDELYVEITILSDSNITIYNKDYDKLSIITSQTSDGDWYGVRCIFTNEVSSIFIPSVWQDNPNWTIYDILKSLSIKANLSSNSWTRSLYIELFTEVGKFT